MAKPTTDLPTAAGAVGAHYGTLRRQAALVQIGNGQQLGSGVSACAPSALDQAASGSNPLPRRPQAAKPSKSADDSARRSRRLVVPSPTVLRGTRS